MEINDNKYSGLSLNEYQRRAISTCTKSSYNYLYMMSNLVGEVGEANSKVAKAIRKENGYIWDDGRFYFRHDCEVNEELLMQEFGDILWQLAGVCKVQGWTLEQVAEANLAKLSGRKKEGTIVGDGDKERTNTKEEQFLKE